MAVPSAISFPQGAHDQLLIAESGPWFQFRNEVISNLIKAHPFQGELYEIGAGNGVVSLHLQNLGYDVSAIEPVVSGANNCSARGIRKVKTATIEELSLHSNSIGAIGAFDVLEHLKSPEKLLLEAHRVLKPRGVFYVTLPAHQFLWSSVDKYSGHFRRYSKKDLLSLFSNNGFEAIECKYFMNLLVLPAFILRVLPEWFGRRPDENASLLEARSVLTQSRSMELCLALEKQLGLSSILPFGSSLVGAFRKE